MHNNTIEEAWEIIYSKFKPWQDNRPDSYVGRQWDGYVPFLFLTGQSDLVEQHNYKVIKDELSDYMSDVVRVDEDKNEFMALEEAKCKHWACGFLDYLLLSQDAPEDLVIKVADIISALEDYHIYYEEGFYQFEEEKIAEAWENMSVRDRKDILVKAKFEQKDIEKLSEDDNGYYEASNIDDSGILRDYLRDWAR
jgi:hypothetical protein